MASPNRKENINPDKPRGQPAGHLDPNAPVFLRRDMNLPHRPALPRPSSPSKSSTIPEERQEINMATPPMGVRLYKNFRVPIDDPPYEDEPDFAAAPPHFSSLADVTAYWNPSDKICQDDDDFSDEFGEITGQHIALSEAITSSARMKNPNNPIPSQPFFQVLVSAEPDEWESIYRTAIELIEKHFPERTHPRAEYPYLVVPKVRFFENDWVEFSATSQSSDRSSGPRDAQKQPVAVIESPQRAVQEALPEAHDTEHDLAQIHSTPESLAKTIRVAEERRPAVSSRLEIPSRQHQSFHNSEDLLGASVALHQQRGIAAAGTVGGVFLLWDLKNKQYIKDSNNDYQRFGITSHHVLRPKGDYELFTPEEADKQRIVVASISQRDRENIYYSAKGYIHSYETALKHVDSRLMKLNIALDDPRMESVKEVNQQAAADLLHLQKGFNRQIAEDRLKIADDHLPHEQPIGTVYLASGRMRKRFTQQMAAFDPQSKKVLLDYGFFRILPEQYDRCNNTVPERITFPAEHPVTHDWNRAHRTIMGQAQLQPDQLIMKVGNRSGVTFGKIMPKRLLSGMMPKVKTMECVAQPASAGQAVAVQGDSGAAVLDSHGHLVGIVAGGRREEKLSKQLPFHVCITPFQVIQEHLRLAFGLTAVPYRGYQDTQPPPRDSPVAPPHFRGYDTVHGLPKTAQDLDLEPTVEEDLTMPPEDPKAEVTDLRIDEAGDYWYHLQWTEYKKDKSEQPVGKGKKASKVESVEVGKEIGTKRFEVEKYCHAWFPACSLDSRWTKAIKDFTATQKVPVNRRAGIKSAFR